MRLDEVMGKASRAALKKKTKKPMGLSRSINKHSKRQQNKAARKQGREECCKTD